MIGQQVREFEILAELGSGGYGVVYRARDTSVDREVAIKVIQPQHASQDEFIANFEREARLVAQLEHKDIVPLYAYWRDEQGAFLVMRYIRGGSLRAMLARQGALPLNKVLRMIEQIAEALHAAHEAGVVHRDLKPDNILIDERGNAYLSDFGIAKQTRHDGAASATDAIKGTFAYLSPEQIQQMPVSPQTDIYALGIMLYEMLTGRHPFQDAPVGVMIVKHLQEFLPDVCEQREELSSAFNDIIQRATDKDAALRYPSTLDLAAELRAAISGAPAAAPMPALPVMQKKKPASPQERNRFAMLQNVRSFWIEGVLENSLHSAVAIDLGTRFESGAVENPWNTVLRTPAGDEPQVSDMTPIEIFDRLNGKLLILGDPGSGKTTTLLTLARELLNRAEQDEQHPLPIIFNLSSWGEKQLPLEEWLVEELSTRYHAPHQFAQTWVQNDALLPLLDGLDEVAEKQRSACVEAINAYRSQHGFVDIVVCSRTLDYARLTEQLRLNGAIVIQPLSPAQVDQYLSAFGSSMNSLRAWIAQDKSLGQMAESPLMLSIMALTYRDESRQMPSAGADVETLRDALFTAYVQRMFERRGTQLAYTREQTMHYLHWLAVKMQDHGQSLFHIEDLQPTWLPTAAQVWDFPVTIRWISSAVMGVFFTLAGLALLVAVGRAELLWWPLCYGLAGVAYGYLFTHPWVLGDSDRQRTLATVIISVLVGVVLGLAAGFIHHRADVGLIYALMAGLSIGLTAIPYHLKWVKRFRTRTDQIVLLERVQYARPRITMRFLTLILPFQVSAGIFYGVGFFPEQLMLSVPGLLVALLLGLIPTVGISLYMEGFTPADVGLRLRPNEGLLATLQNMAKFGGTTMFLALFWAVGAAILGVSVWGALLLWLALALHFGTDTILSHGGIPFLQHLYLRYQLEKTRSIPRRIDHFLDHAAMLILLRKVGGGYIFIHRYLLEYFAAAEVRKAG